MRTTALLIVALVALAACTGGASAAEQDAPVRHLLGEGGMGASTLMERHSAKHEAAMEHITDAAAGMKATRAAVHEAAKDHIDAAHERFKQSMTAALKAMSDAASAWHEHVAETTAKYAEMHADVKESVQERVSDTRERKADRAAKVMSAVSDAHSSDAPKMNSHGMKGSMKKGGRHLLGDKSTMGWHEAKAAKTAAKRSRWAEWIMSKFERKQAVRAAVREHVSDSAGKFHGGKKHGGKKHGGKKHGGKNLKN